MKMKSKKGISLIVLVITIIVMIILASAIILSLNNSGVIEKANEAVTATNEATVKEMASVAWAEAYADGVRTVEDSNGQEGFQKRVEAALQGMDVTKYDIKITTSGVTVSSKDNGQSGDTGDTAALNPSGTIPAGAKYIAADGTTYNEGDNFPSTMNPLDRYETEDYVYVYKAAYTTEPNPNNTNFASTFREETGLDGWMVTTFEKAEKSTYGSILESINGEKVISAADLFRHNDVIEVAPLIPKNINNVSGMFYNCISLKELPEGFSIPANITATNGMFYRCLALTELPSSLVIHENITNVYEMFGMCGNLKGTITVDANPTSYSRFLSQCDATQITIGGKTTLKTELLATANN